VRKLLLALALLLPEAGPAQVLEHEVKAAYLFRFLSFIEWPAGAFASPQAPIAIGVLGADDVLYELQDLVLGRTVQGRGVTVQRVRPGESVAGLQVLFAGSRAAEQLARIGPAHGLLVVSDAPYGLELGAAVNFVRAEGRVRFEVAVDAAERRGIRISSRMLAVASQVRPGKP
jgi:hypothetical protein